MPMYNQQVEITDVYNTQVAIDTAYHQQSEVFSSLQEIVIIDNNVAIDTTPIHGLDNPVTMNLTLNAESGNTSKTLIVAFIDKYRTNFPYMDIKVLFEVNNASAGTGSVFDNLGNTLEFAPSESFKDQLFTISNYATPQTYTSTLGGYWNGNNSATVTIRSLVLKKKQT